MVFILLLPFLDRWSRQQRRHSLKYRLSLPDRFQCCAQHSVGSQSNSDTFLITAGYRNVWELPRVWGNGIPIKSPITENKKVRKSAFVLRGGSCSLKIQTLSLITNKCLDNTSSCEKVFSVLWGGNSDSINLI